MADRYIAVAGNIGVGKTTLVTYLEDRYGLTPVLEPFADNPYLDDFYADMRAWAFHSQVWFLSHKYRVHKELERTGGTLIQDRTIYEDAEIFAAYLYRSRRMRKRDWQTYDELQMPVSYLRTLNRLYGEWIESWDRSPVIVWDTERQDYITDLVDRIDFHKAIEAIL